MTVLSPGLIVARNALSHAATRGADRRGLEEGDEFLRQRRGVDEGKGLGVGFDEEIERVDHRHVGGQGNPHLELVRALGEHQPRHPVAVGILLPVEEVLRRRDRERVAQNRGAGLGRRTQPDLVRAHVDEAVEHVGRAVLQRDADGHALGADHQSGFGSCANTRRSPSPHCEWIIWKYGSVSSMRRCRRIFRESVS